MTATDLDKLKKAYYRGVLKVREGDTWVEYQSMKDMRIAINDAEAELANLKPTGARLVRTNKGY
jgi:hypothetical protein